MSSRCFAIFSLSTRFFAHPRLTRAAYFIYEILIEIGEKCIVTKDEKQFTAEDSEKGDYRGWTQVDTDDARETTITHFTTKKRRPRRPQGPRTTESFLQIQAKYRDEIQPRMDTYGYA
jgi:hypothetical protein